MHDEGSVNCSLRVFWAQSMQQISFTSILFKSSHPRSIMFRILGKFGGLCMLTNECSKGGELLATGQLSNSSPSHDYHTHATYFRKAHFACHCTPSLVSWDLSEDRFPDIGPQGLSNILQHNCALFCNICLIYIFILYIYDIWLIYSMISSLALFYFGNFSWLLVTPT